MDSITFMRYTEASSIKAWVLLFNTWLLFSGYSEEHSLSSIQGNAEALCLEDDLWMAHCSYLRSGGEKNLELLEICIIYSVFFLSIYLTGLCRIMERKRKNNMRMADQGNQWQSTICKPNFYSVPSHLAATKVSIYLECLSIAGGKVNGFNGVPT
jgi:hypothetical protein